MLTPFIRRMQSSRDELFLPVAVGPARPRNASASRAGGPCEFYEAADRKDRRPWSRGRRPDVIDDDNVAASRTIDDAILTQPPPPRPPTRPRREDRCWRSVWTPNARGTAAVAAAARVDDATDRVYWAPGARLSGRLLRLSERRQDLRGRRRHAASTLTTPEMGLAYRRRRHLNNYYCRQE